MGVARCFGATGDHDLASGDLSLAMSSFGGQLDQVRIEKRRSRLDELDAVTCHLITDDVDLGSHDLLNTVKKIVDGDLLLHSVRRTVDASLAISREMQNRLSKGLRGDRAVVDADSTDGSSPFDDCNRPA